MEPVAKDTILPGHGPPINTGTHRGAEIVFIRQNYKWKSGWAHVALGYGGHCYSGHTVGRF